MNSMGRPFAVYADCQDSGKPVEMFSIEQQKSRLVLASGDNLVDPTREMLVETTKWLPAFAEQYNISADLRDYVMVPVVIMPSDLPNRNAQAFPYEELIKANVEVGRLAYQTWTAKPTFQDHQNSDHTKAKGIIFASVMRPIPRARGNLWKVICLCGYDRSTQPVLANQILTGERNSYSMGAWSEHFICSICGAVHNAKQPGCDHINIKMPRLTKYDNGKLAYAQARNILGFEVSSVQTPAYFSATTNDIMTWDK